MEIFGDHSFKQLGMDTSVIEIMCKNPVCTYLGEDKATLLSHMKQKDIFSDTQYLIAQGG